MMIRSLYLYMIAVANILLIISIFGIATTFDHTLRFRSIQNLFSTMQVAYDLTIYLLFSTLCFVIFAEIAKKTVDLGVIINSIYCITEEVNRQNEEDELTSQRYARDKEILEKIADENQEDEQLRGVVEVNEDLPPPAAVPTTPKKLSKQMKPNERTDRKNASIKTPKLENIDRVRKSREKTTATAHAIATARSKSAKCKSRMNSTSLIDATQGTLEEAVKYSPESEQKLLSAKEATASTAKSFEQPGNANESDLKTARNADESDLKTARNADESDLKTAREKETRADTLLQLFTEKASPDASIRSVYMI
uniref:Uncharacterized protein n=1 Tax=Parascaris univalens TaxID=6257 RepID=A0A915API4_PARUN